MNDYIKPRINIFCIANPNNGQTAACNLHLDEICLHATHRQADLDSKSGTLEINRGNLI
ncbi:MAG: hypothetical protein IEMM0003_0966 [bacterium]|nr:MAG: hypothetical protein IEMM0003_0966 [bacterium]